MENILILHDRHGYVAGSLIPEDGRKIKADRLKERLEEKGYHVELRSLHGINFPTEYKGWYVVYPSSESQGLFYKSYIEDIMLSLNLDGANLMPRFELFRAHHNKSFMELYRNRLSEEYRTIQGKAIFFPDEIGEAAKEMRYPLVLKISAGAGSSGVALAHNEKEAEKKSKKMGKLHFHSNYWTPYRQFRHWGGKYIRAIKKLNFCETQNIREKMIVQPFVPGLQCDYKVLVFGEKYYLLCRDTRENDFRASGSGKLHFPDTFTEKEKAILEFARGAYWQLDTPMLSIDVAWDGSRCHMIEYQCLNFGPYTLQRSECYYKKETEWVKIEGRSVLEDEMANAYDQYIKEHS